MTGWTTVLFDAVLFDLDGTLLDTLEDIADAANLVLSRRHFPVHPVDAYKRFVGEGARVLVWRLVPPDARDEDLVDAMYAEFRSEYSLNWNAKTKPYDGIPEMLDGLVERKLKIAVLSNKPDDFTRQCVDRLLSRWTFDAVLGHHDGIPPKPDPTGALQIARDLRLPPARMLFLGDSSIDMETALAAGMTPGGVLWGFRDREELEKSGARAIVGSPHDVFALLERA
ncbi:MAG: pgp [Candidatus Krumholzibacteriota bacterium]|nr:pgp [Candidatus Krumholzibacteriota bacterium]